MKHRKSWQFISDWLKTLKKHHDIIWQTWFLKLWFIIQEDDVILREVSQRPLLSSVLNLQKSGGVHGSPRRCGMMMVTTLIKSPCICNSRVLINHPVIAAVSVSRQCWQYRLVSSLATGRHSGSSPWRHLCASNSTTTMQTLTCSGAQVKLWK